MSLATTSAWIFRELSPRAARLSARRRRGRVTSGSKPTSSPSSPSPLPADAQCTAAVDLGYDCSVRRAKSHPLMNDPDRSRGRLPDRVSRARVRFVAFPHSESGEVLPAFAISTFLHAACRGEVFSLLVEICFFSLENPMVLLHRCRTLKTVRGHGTSAFRIHSIFPSDRPPLSFHRCESPRDPHTFGAKTLACFMSVSLSPASRGP